MPSDERRPTPLTTRTYRLSFGSGIHVRVVDDAAEIDSPLSDELGLTGDVIDSVILAHAAAGIDVGDAAYVAGINAAIEAVANHVDDEK